MSHVPPPIVKAVDGVFLIELSNDYSHLQEPFVERLSLLRALSDSAEPPRVVLDMANVELIGSAFIGLLMSCSKALAARGGSIALANVNSFCKTAIGLTRFSALLPTCGSVADAVDHLTDS